MGLILEYEGKDLFRKYKIPLLPAILVKTPEEAVEAAGRISKFPVAVKAQVLSGGRGKRGLIQIANNAEEVVAKAKDIMAKDDKGRPVTHLLIEEGADIGQELFISMLHNRENLETMVLFSMEGGVDIETLAKERPEAIERFFIPFGTTAYPYQFMAGLGKRGLEGKQKVKVAAIIATLVNMMAEEDLQLAEINPLAITKAGEVIALDARVVTDDNAMFRHPEREQYLSEELRDTTEEKDAKAHDLAYVDLGGAVGMLSCGAGMGMATADLIAEFGGSPRNFLDVGGGASPEKVENALRIMVGAGGDLRSILINAFGGITRLDDVAKGIIEAKNKYNIEIPMVIRLMGTNQEEGVRILREAGLEAFEDMEPAIEKAVKLASGEA